MTYVFDRREVMPLVTVERLRTTAVVIQRRSVRDRQGAQQRHAPEGSSPTAIAWHMQSFMRMKATARDRNSS